MRKRSAVVAHALAACALTMPCFGTASAQLPELKLSTAQGPAYALGRAGQRWAELLSERAEGAFEVRTYPGAVLASRDPQREFGAVRDGAADLAVGSALAWSAQLPALAAYVLPWLAPEVPAQDALASDARLRDLVAAAAARAGVVVVAVAPLGERVLATVQAAVVAPSTMQGLRLRAPPNLLVLETLAALGARGDAMGLADARTAFASGLLDGQLGTASSLAATRIGATGQRFVTRMGAFADFMVFAVRAAVWQSWSPDQRAAARVAALAAAHEAGALAREEAAFAELTQQGVTLVMLTSDQRAAFRDAVKPVWKKWTSVIGNELVEIAEAAADAAPAK